MEQLRVYHLHEEVVAGKRASVQDKCNRWSRKLNIQFVLLFGMQYLPYKVSETENEISSLN